MLGECNRAGSVRRAVAGESFAKNAEGSTGADWIVPSAGGTRLREACATTLTQTESESREYAWSVYNLFSLSPTNANPYLYRHIFSFADEEKAMSTVCPRPGIRDTRVL